MRAWMPRLALAVLLAWPGGADAAVRTRLSASQFLAVPPVLAGDRAVWLSGDAVSAWDGRRRRVIHELPAAPPADATDYLLAASRSTIAVGRLSFVGDKVFDTAEQLIQVLRRGTRRPLTLRSRGRQEFDCAADLSVWSTFVAVTDLDCGPTTITVYDTRGGAARRHAVVGAGDSSTVRLAGRYLAWSDVAEREVTIYDWRARRTVRRFAADYPGAQVKFDLAADGTVALALGHEYRRGARLAWISPRDRGVHRLRAFSTRNVFAARGRIAALQKGRRIAVFDLEGKRRHALTAGRGTALRDFDGNRLLWTEYPRSGGTDVVLAATEARP